MKSNKMKSNDEMKNVKSLLDFFEEEVYSNTISGFIRPDDLLANQGDHFTIFLKFEESDGRRILFSFMGKPLRFDVDSINGEIDLNDDNIADSYIFWLIFNAAEPKIKYIKIGNHRKVEKFSIGYEQQIFDSGKDCLKSDEILNNEFIFKYNNEYVFFIKKFNRNGNIQILGLNKVAEIEIESNKWVIKRIVKRRFTKDYKEFHNLDFIECEKIEFEESSKVIKMLDLIKDQNNKSDTLLKIWKKYSDKELERVKKIKDKFGEIKFHVVSHKQGGITRISLKEINDEKRSFINDNKEIIQNSQFSINQNVENPIRLVDIDQDCVLEFIDELSILPEKGLISLSIKGNEIANKRREMALDFILKSNLPVIRNIYLSIEGKGEALPHRKIKYKALTDRTKIFLREKLGIEELTENQKAAIELAINTPDIAIIQGPPGTGKTSVIAAVCDRLMEISEKETKNEKSRLILISAYQNDTLEHLATKIYSYGCIGTPKLGKNSSTVTAESELAEKIKISIDKNLQEMDRKCKIVRNSSKIKNIISIFHKEDDIENIYKNMNLKEIVNSTSSELRSEYEQIFKLSKNDKNTSFLNLIQSIPTDIDSYNHLSEGYRVLSKLKYKHSQLFSENEINFLDKAPLKNPDDSFLMQLEEFKLRYINILTLDDMQTKKINKLVSKWLNKLFDYLQKQEKISNEDVDTYIYSNLESLRVEIDENIEFIKESIKEYTDSIAATNQISGSHNMSAYGEFQNVVLEEAARSNPLDLLIPITKANQKVIMIGDQKQLPHILEHDIVEEMSKENCAESYTDEFADKLKESLFGILFDNLRGRNRTITLKEQFRMHPFIGDFISRVYYGGELKAGSKNQYKDKLHKLKSEWFRNKVAVFVDAGNRPETGRNSKSRKDEANKIITILDEIKKDPEYENLTIGIISFYSGQIQQIFKAASESANKYSKRNENGSFEINFPYQRTFDGREKMKIGTVDSFQGKEFDVIILSSVRSNRIERIKGNENKVFGFLTLENRLNVAFSRAKKLLIVTGDYKMFSDDYAKESVRGLYEFCTKLAMDEEYGNKI